MGFFSCTVKYFLFIFNFIVVVCGIALIVIGSLAYSNGEDLVKISTSKVTAPSIAIIVLGVIIFLIAFLGCCGAMQDSPCLITMYSALLLTILIVEGVIAILAFVYHNQVENELQKDTETMFRHYWNDTEANKTVDSIQQSFECCGLGEGPSFWTKQNMSIPWSCCGNRKDVVNGTQGACPVASAWHSGCDNTVIKLFKKWLNVIGGVAIGFAAFEVAGVIFGLCLASHMRRRRTV